MTNLSDVLGGGRTIGDVNSEGGAVTDQGGCDVVGGGGQSME